jgi:hypothetical protein
MLNILKFGKKLKILKDAKEVLSDNPREYLESAFDSYKHIKEIHSEQYDEFDNETYEMIVKSYEAITKLIKLKGDFKKLLENKDESYLHAILKGHLYLSDAIHVLIDHHDDKEEADFIFNKHPELHKKLPKQYDNNRQVLEVLLESIKDFQWQLEHFSMKYYGEIKGALGEEHERDDVYVMPD